MPGAAIALIVDAPAPDHARSVLWDLGRAAQNIMLAAWDMGIGSCPITVNDFDLAADVLGLPADKQCQYIIALGWPADPDDLTRPSRVRRPQGLPRGRPPRSAGDSTSRAYEEGRMKARIGTMVAAVAAAASAAGAAAWTRRKRAEKDGVDVEVKDATGVASQTSRAARTRTSSRPRAGKVRPRAGRRGADDLTTLKGLGALSAERLAELGVTRLAQIAAWSDADVERIAPQINIAADRIRRDDWVGQARAATKG